MADTSLSALFPALPFRVGGERVHLRPVILAELPAVERAWEAWRRMVAFGKDLDPDALEDVLELLAGASGKPLAWVKALDDAAFTDLVSLVLALNREIFEPPSASGGEDLAWSQVLQKLIEHGHSREDAERLTLAQARTYLEACLREEREAMADGITCASFSMADGKQTQKIVKELRRGR